MAMDYRACYVAMSTTIFAKHCHGNVGRDYPQFAVGKRVRARKYKAFGLRLKQWRGKTDIPIVVDRIRRMGIRFSETTLRSWEYGWIGAPDPLALRALAALYGKTLADAIDALMESRGEGVTLPQDVEPAPTNVTGFSSVPLVAGRIAAGEPLALEEYDFSGTVAFPERFLAGLSVPRCVRVGDREESMVPLIMPGDVVLLECNLDIVLPPKIESVYAVRVPGDEGATLKRIEFVKDKTGGKLMLISENQDKVRYKTKALQVEEGQEYRNYVIGEVMWKGQAV